MTQHIVNISGGKDSTACYLLAIERGKPFRAVMADTGHEHPLTMEYAMHLGDRTGGPQVEIYKADFSRQMAGKRAFIAKKWADHGVPQVQIDRALEILQPTGIPFLDLILWKGRFPSRLAQFCTEELKTNTIAEQVINPARQAGPVVQWLGVRRDESLNRRFAPMWQVVRTPGLHAMRFYRPLIHWTAGNTFAYAALRGLDPNPLYLEGMGRVGCFPCINSNKAELRAIAARFPEAFDKIKEWEDLTALASKRGVGTFFAADTTPEGAEMVQVMKRRADREIAREYPEADDKLRKLLVKQRRNDISATLPWPDAYSVKKWAMTDRGGRQFNLLRNQEDDGVSCSSQYGLCE